MREILEEYSEHILEPMIKYMKLGIDEVTQEKTSTMSEVQPKTEMNMVSQVCALMDIIMTETKLDVHNFDQEHLVKIFIFSVVWGLGACIQYDERIRFNKILMALLEKQDMERPANCKSLFDLYLDVKDGDCKFFKWTSLKSAYVPPADGSFAKILVPTEETAK
jgi:hypothetical protein